MFAITPGEEEAGSCYRAHIHAAAVVIVIAIAIVIVIVVAVVVVRRRRRVMEFVEVTTMLMKKMMFFRSHVVVEGRGLVIKQAQYRRSRESGRRS